MSYSCFLTVTATQRPSMDGSRPSPARSPSFGVSPPRPPDQHSRPGSRLHLSEKEPQSNLQAIPITISPASPVTEVPPPRMSSEKKRPAGLRVRRSSSTDRDTSTSKRVQQMLKNRVHKGRAGITTISRKIGSGVVRNGNLKRSNSTPG